MVWPSQARQGWGGWAKRAKLISSRQTLSIASGVVGSFERRTAEGVSTATEQLGAPQTVFDLVLPFAAGDNLGPVQPHPVAVGFLIVPSIGQPARSRRGARSSKRAAACGPARRPLRRNQPSTGDRSHHKTNHHDARETGSAATRSSGTLQKVSTYPVRSNSTENSGALCTVAAKPIFVSPLVPDHLDTSVANQVQRAPQWQPLSH